MTASEQTAKAAAIAAAQKYEHSSLAPALIAALEDLTVVEAARTAEIPMKSGGKFSYKYADIADVVSKTRPVLAKHGLVALTPVHDHGTGLACTVVLLHTSGERLDLGPFPFPPGHDAQSTGSSVTYHRRYALIAALGMAAGDDDDGAAAKPRQAQPKAEPHPLRAEVAALGDDGKLWADFLARAGISDADADGVLRDNAGGWRDWLTDALAFLAAKDDSDQLPLEPAS